MKVLSFTTLFPNAAQPVHGIFVENRLRHLALSGAGEVRVVAPVPWFPFGPRWSRRYGTYAIVPKREHRHGIVIEHPRFPTLPKIGMTIAPALLAASQVSVFRRIIDEGYDFDLLDAHYFYPDGVAAALLGRWFRKPVVITSRGSDVSQIPRHSLPRRQILWAAAQAAGLITVCQALKDALVELGVPSSRVSVLRNGVDLQHFLPLDGDAGRAAARREWGLRDFALVSVGQLIERKGHHLIIEALPRLPGVTLAVAGDGPERASLASLAKTLGVEDRVRLLGLVPQAKLPSLYAAADALVLASSREGWANVLLEAMACGTPVVATRIWGTPEVVTEPAAGLLIDRRDAASIAQGVAALRAALPERRQTRAFAEGFSWDATTAGQIALFRDVIARNQSRA